jgi:kumamolisin
MATREKMVQVTGSEPPPHPNAKAVGPADPSHVVEITVRVRPRASSDFHNRTEAMLNNGHALRNGGRMGREEFAAAHGADPADLAKVEAFARAHGLTVVGSHAARRSVILAGTVAKLQEAFGVELKTFEHPGGSYRGRTGPVMIPESLADVVEGVFGLSNRPIAKPHFQRRKAVPHAGPGGAMTPVEVAQLYDFPAGADGTGQCIAIIELGGGYVDADLDTYFQNLGVPRPQVVAVPVDGGQNQPTGDPNGPDGEVMLDIEVAGAVAPKAQIVVYFAPNTDRGFLDAITTAVHDTTYRPSVISISWGSAESNWTRQAMRSFDQAFRSAAAMGVSVCVAAGDNGSDDGVGDGRNHVDFPASSPFALGCGGTRLVGSGTSITNETVWNDGPGSATGGGVSSFFAKPAYQAGAQVPTAHGRGGRGVPDVSGDADPVTGYKVRVDGEDAVIGGTSAVAPLWAGLIALMNQRLGHPVGYINPAIYQLSSATQAFHDITVGNNGAFSAGPGWDACTGMGTPDGDRLLHAIS